MSDTQSPQTTAPVAPVAKNETQNTPAAPVESDEKFFAALGYFAFLFVIPLIVKPKSAYCKFHSRQSMVMFLGAIVVLIILGLIPWIGSLLTLALFALYVIAIYRAYLGDLWSIPVVSTFAGKLDVDALYGKAGLAVGSISGMKEKAAQMANQAASAAKDLGKQEADKPAAEQPAPQAPAAPTAPTPTEKPKA